MKAFYSSVGMSFSGHGTSSRSWSMNWAFSALSHAGLIASYISDVLGKQDGVSISFGFSR